MKSKFWNAVLAVIIATGMIVSFYYLERAFRGGDTRRAVQAVQQTRPAPNQPTVLEALQKQYGRDAKFQWIAEIKNSFRGIIEVKCYLPDQKTRSWLVNVLTGTISETTQNLGNSGG